MSSRIFFAVLLLTMLLSIVAMTSSARAQEEFETADEGAMQDVAVADGIEPLTEADADAAAADFDVQSETFAEADADADATCKQTTVGLNVRRGPSTRYGVLRTLPTGTRVTEHSRSNGWSNIGNNQYVSSQYLRACSGSSSGGGGSGSTSGGNKCAHNAPLFKQCGQSWSNQYLRSQTVCQVGCLMSSVSMGMARFGKRINGSGANPGTLNTWLKSHGGYTSGNLFIWGAVAPFGLHYQGQTSSLSTIRSRVCQGNTIVVLALKSRGHWILARGVTAGGDFIVNDPGFTRTVLPASDVRIAGVYTV